jgi:Uma2 family endonuclease
MGRYESQVGLNIAFELKKFIRAKKAGGVLSGADGMMRMQGDNIRMADVCWTAPEDMRDPEHKQAAPQEPPTLAVEVVSPGNTATEMKVKLQEYFASGCRLAWLVYPERREVEVFRTAQQEPLLVREDAELDGYDVLPGLRLPVVELFKM